jgi:C-terminal processing protease CtpA/Prc
MRTILTQLTKKGVTSLVFDLRGNGGGLLTHARDIAGLFVKEGPCPQGFWRKGNVEIVCARYGAQLTHDWEAFITLLRGALASPAAR